MEDQAALTLDEPTHNVAGPLRPHAPLHRGVTQAWTSRTWRLKRSFDLVGAVALVLLLLPVLLLAAVAVKISGRGPILYRQRRVGLHGFEFTMLKFRTFPTDHVDRRQLLRTTSPAATTESILALSIDQSPSRVGRFLRRTSIDELPQLFNVIRGDMSLVGPRPELPHFASALAVAVPGYVERHRVLGGITGLAQVRGLWGLGDIEKRVEVDNRYIETWSVWKDIRILLETLPELFVKAFPR
jgi:lipopolysaccharide/colanic/teichoic acid biosynthesis glycosyltransferase